jgi:DNA-binding response OmpR family regulator
MTSSGKKILLIERAGKPEQTFAPALAKKGFMFELVGTGQVALDHLGAMKPVMVILNSASLGSSGLRICRQIQDASPGTPIIHIVLNGALADAKVGAADITLVMPFTHRKLVNSVKRLLPVSRQDVIQVGPIQLAPHAQVVWAYGRERRLTAKTTALLQLFLQHRGEILDRGYLMRHVWETDYIGDTRTLDVHIRWVREAIEPDPKKPRHILTMRGQGYRFVADITS